MTENKLRECMDNQQKITLHIRPNKYRNTMSKIVNDSIGFNYLWSVIGLGSLCRPFDQSGKSIHIFPTLQALCQFFSLSYLWFFVIFLLLEQFPTEYRK